MHSEDSIGQGIANSYNKLHEQRRLRGRGRFSWETGSHIENFKMQRLSINLSA